MKGFDDATYGDSFADVYDDWYDDVSDVDATTTLVDELARGGHVLELGVGTGRLAVPLARAGCAVVGIDASEAMLERCRAKSGDLTLELILGDMIEAQPDRTFDAVLVAYNTIFSLTSAERQQALFDTVARRLSDGGAFIVEAAVPDPRRKAGGTVGVRSVQADRVVLSVDVHHPEDQRVDGQFVEFTPTGGVRLRPWSIRYSSPEELDQMATRAGLRLRNRWEDMGKTVFAADSATHVSVYTR
ncbi:MAG: class I SAM-dependent methyltransferase [Actinobacteria bacterium]|nr:class I SAM-dependent methyltransferase [Actinomycetota bacterium]